MALNQDDSELDSKDNAEDETKDKAEDEAEEPKTEAWITKEED
jgi:type V secretory pathway adhesin AidA